MIIRTLNLFCLVLFAVNITPAQSLEKEILRKTSVFQSIYHQEKIFVQTDRPVYVAGEEIWFSAFIINAASQRLNQTERILYIELISLDGTTCQKEVFKINRGRAWGSISLQPELKSGNYHLVAFTNWMRNSGSEFYFSKQIYISPESETAIADTLSTGTPDSGIQNENKGDHENTKHSPEMFVSFFPEGGDLIQGINCRVAFEINDEFGNSLNANGLVVDETGQIVAAANTIWKGKGMFMFTPQTGHEYFLRLGESNNEQKQFKLPAAKPAGLAIAVLDMAKQQQVKVIVNKSDDLPSDSAVFLLGMQNGIAKRAFAIDLSDKQTANILINKSDFNSGIVQFTLFDANKMPQAERLFFVKDTDQLTINIIEKSLAPTPRGKVELMMEVSDQHGKPVVGDFALSVTDALRVPDATYHSPDIFQYLTLYADLPEYKSDTPSLFKNSVAANVKSDLLMLTNGWRRYRWEEVLADTVAVPRYFEEPAIYVKGTVRTSSKKDKIPDDAEVSMITEGKMMELFSEKVGKDGAFTFLLKDFENTMRAVVQTKNRMNYKKDYALNLTTNYQEKPADNFSHLSETNLHSLYSFSTPLEKEGKTIEKGVLKKQLTRALTKDTFEITTDFAIEEVTVLGDKTKKEKEEMSQKYGSPHYSVGKKQIEELVKEKPWHWGLMSILSNAFPNLNIEAYQSTMTHERYSGSGSPPQTSNISVSNSSSIRFKLIGEERHRFFIFVDGELITASDVVGLATKALRGYTIDDLISLDPELVTSIDLIFPNKNNSHSELTSAAVIYEYEFRNTASQTPDAVMAGDLAELIDESDKQTTPIAVLSIYTKEGAGLYSSDHFKGIANLTLHGFTRVKEFYQPNYSTDGTDSILSDFRNTLAWLPNLHTDSAGKAPISFYTSDISNTFRVELNGLSDQGNIGALQYKRDKPMFDPKSVHEITKEDQPDENNHLTGGLRILLPDSTGAAYALVGYPGEGWSTFTSPEGYFSTPEKKMNETIEIEISKPGYETLISPYIGQKVKNTILLAADYKKSGLSVEEVLKYFYRNQSKNRNPNDFYLEGAYREQLFNREELHQLTDYYFIQQWPSRTETSPNIKTHLYSGRIFRSDEVNEKIHFTPQNRFNDAVPVMDPLMEELSFLKQAFAKNYRFNLVGETSFEGRDMYHVTFDQKEDTPWALYEGELYIDAETFGLAWASWRISDKGKKYLMPDEYLEAGGDPETFEVEHEHNEITFSFNRDFWIPKFAISNITFSQKSERNTILREIAWKPAIPVNKFKPLLPEDMAQRFTLKKAPKYKPGDWRVSWLLPPSPEISNQIQYLNNVTEYRQ